MLEGDDDEEIVKQTNKQQTNTVYRTWRETRGKLYKSLYHFFSYFQANGRGAQNK